MIQRLRGRQPVFASSGLTLSTTAYGLRQEAKAIGRQAVRMRDSGHKRFEDRPRRRDNGVMVAVVSACRKCADVAAQRTDNEVRTAFRQLTLATQTGRPDDTTRGRDRPGDIYSRQTRRADLRARKWSQTETVREGHRNVFHRCTAISARFSSSAISETL